MKKAAVISLLIIALVLVSSPVWSQCAMCTQIADESTKNGSTVGDGINKGVLYLFLSPYLIVATIGFLWWRSRRRAQEAAAKESLQPQI